MITTARKIFLVLAFSFLLVPFVRADQEEDKDKMAEEMKKYRFENITTKEGFKFNIPSDMPIERKDGLVTPIPFDEYLYIKFKMLEERIGKMEKHLDDMEKNILSKMAELKAQQNEISKKISDRAAPSQQAS